MSIRHTLAAIAVIAFAGLAHAQSTPTTELPRRGTIGFGGSPDGSGGLVISQVRPKGPAEVAGLRPGDRLLTLNGAKTEDSATLQEAVRQIRAGQTATLNIVRDGKPQTLTATLEAIPSETVEGSVVTYSSVKVPAGYRLRTIITEPKAAKDAKTKSPAFFFIQGLMCQSLDRAQVATAPDTMLVHAMARQGYVTIRVDKPGTGDSEGPPCGDVDFKTELAAYSAALAQLKSLPTVDPERVYVFGHSMGSVMAPYLIKESPVRGAIVYGTVARNWMEYMLETTRRQVALAGVPAGDVEAEVMNTARLYGVVLLEKKTVGDAWNRFADLKAEPGPMMDEQRIFGRHVTFFHQLQDLNLPRAWEEAATNIYAIHGEFDPVTSPVDHEMLAELAKRGGKVGEFESLLRADHVFTTHNTIGEAVSKMSQGEFSIALPSLIQRWVDKVEGRS